MDSPANPVALSGAPADYSSGRQQVTIRWRGTRLRARKIEQAMPSLDQRIRATLTRRLRRATKPHRKPIALRQHIKMPIAQLSLGRTPTRRIDVVVRNHLVSSKAVTKIIGAPARNPRVRVAALHIG
jgi:hypothetical protein